MIIEFTGCSGAGKTAILDEVCQELLRRGVPVERPAEAMFGRGMSQIQQWPRLENMVLDAAVVRNSLIGMFVRGTKAERTARHLSYSVIKRYSRGLVERLRLIRCTARKLALDQALRKSRYRRRIVLVDEGVIHLSQMLFGRRLPEPELELCRRFAEVAPRPHLLVWVKALPELRELRIEERNTHKPLPSGSPEERKLFLRNADKVIDATISGTDEGSWVIVVENNRQDKNELKNHANHIANIILDRQANCPSTDGDSLGRKAVRPVARSGSRILSLEE